MPTSLDLDLLLAARTVAVSTQTAGTVSVGAFGKRYHFFANEG